MKNLRLLLLSTCSLFIFSCSSDDDTPITPVNEVELITSVKMTFTPVAGGNNVVLDYQDLDGEGGTPPRISISRPFERSKTYNGTVILRNELANPAIDVTPEIIAEAVEHQFFYQTTGNLPRFTYANVPSNFDRNGKPFGIQSVVTTTNAAAGILQLSLRHGPNKSAVNVADGIIDNAGGATDIEVRFNISVE